MICVSLSAHANSDSPYWGFNFQPGGVGSAAANRSLGDGVPRSLIAQYAPAMNAADGCAKVTDKALMWKPITVALAFARCARKRF